MPGTDPNWDDHDESQGAFENLLERVTSRFTPAHNSHYEPGFVPAGSPNWNVQMTAPDSNNESYDQNVGVFPNRSFSVNQEPYTDAGHTPLNRSTSDLGSRINDYSSEVFQPMGTMTQHGTMENFGSGFYSNPSNVIQSSSMNTMPNLSGYNSAPSDSGLNYLPQDSQTISCKLSNFTATLGTWASPYESKTPNTMDSIDENFPNSASQEGYQQSVVDREPHHHSYNVHSSGIPPANSKPSYSDVLSKAPSLDKVNLNMNPIQQAKNMKNNQHTKHRNDNSKNSSGKHKNRYGNNNNTARCNSPNLSINGASGKGPKSEQPSKVGLDNFDVAGISQIITQNAVDLKQSFGPSSKSCNLDSGAKIGKKAESLSSSPAHQQKRNKKDKYEECQDILEKSVDQLNNHVLSNQKKQTLKKPSFINNVLNAPNATSSASIKKNNSDFVAARKGSNVKEAKLYHDTLEPGNKRDGSIGNSTFSGYGSGKEADSSPRGGTSPRSYRNSGSKMTKESLKKNNSRRKREECLSDHSEMFWSIWSFIKLWLDVLGRAGGWLFMITLDVIHMSYGLFMQIGKDSFDTGCVYWLQMRQGVTNYCRNGFNYLWRKKDQTSGSSERKIPAGLGSNIPLPATGEAAMKRLLAGRGKDPYSILGVMRTCSDEDIKKYYKRQAFLVHPDKNKQPGAEEAFKILAHAFELIGEPDRRAQYDAKLSEEVQMEGAWSELSLLMTRLREKLEEAANTIRCTNCNKRHKRVKQERPVYGARYCAECQFMHAAREGDIWAERTLLGLRWRYYACMEGAIYDITEWASCQRENLKHLQANTHSVQYRIVSGKKNAPGRSAPSECPTEPELEEFFNNLCRERFGQDFASQSSTFTQTDARRRKAKKRK